jgi:hypothetical protein
MQIYVGAQGFKTSECTSPQHLYKLARVLFGVPHTQPSAISDYIVRLGRKGRSKAADMNRDAADLVFANRMALPGLSEIPTDEESLLIDDGSQEWLDAYSAREWADYLERMKGMYWRIKDRDEKAAYSQFLWYRFKIRP